MVSIRFPCIGDFRKYCFNIQHINQKMMAKPAPGTVRCYCSLQFGPGLKFRNLWMMKTYSVLFVCMGNICRSPTAHGVFQHKVEALGLQHRIRVDSAGTHNYHPNSPPDARSQAHASRRGFELSRLRARQILDADFEAHDLILVMDWDNLALVQSQSPLRHHSKIRRLTEFCESHDCTVVPDPYYSGEKGFEEVLDLVEDACEGLLKHVQRQLEIT